MKYFSLIVLMFGFVLTSFGQSLTESATYDLNARKAALTAQINANSGNAEFLRVANILMDKYNGAEAPVTLFEQTVGGTSGIISKMDGGTLDTESAEDFEVPANKKWILSEVFAPGFLSVGSPAPTGVTVRIYSDNAGIPGGLVHEETNGTMVFTGDIMVSLPSPIELTAGIYWVVVMATNTTAGPNGFRWNWFQGAESNLSGAHLRNFGGGFGIDPTTWRDFPSLGVTFADLAVTIIGEEEDDIEVVPTMGEWGLMSLGLILLIFGVVAVGQRRTSIA